MGDEECGLLFGKIGKSLKDLALGSSVERRGRLVQDQQLRVAQMRARQGDFLPFAAGQVDPAFEAASKELVVYSRQLLDYALGEAFPGCRLNLHWIDWGIDAPHGDIFSDSHVVVHEILKNYADFVPPIFQVVFPKVDAVEEDPSFGGVVQARQKFCDRRLALAVFARPGRFAREAPAENRYRARLECDFRGMRTKRAGTRFHAGSAGERR